MSNTVTSEEVAVYRDAVKAYARRFTGIANAEFDDLEQEGLIAVWQSLAGGHRPSEWMIKNRMKSYLRVLGRRGFGGYESLDSFEL